MFNLIFSSDGADGETDIDGVADELWKSFEDCALSPHLCTLMTSPRPSVHQKQDPSAQPCNLSASQQSVPLERCSVQLPVRSLTTTAATMETTTATSAVCVHEPVGILSDISISNSPCSAADYATPLSAGNACNCSKSLPNNCPVVCGTSRKRVHFPHDSKLVSVHRVVVWNFAYRAARKGPWEQFARDRAHFRRRVEGVASVLEPCLAARRAATYKTECVNC